jgi:hypothetical protein
MATRFEVLTVVIGSEDGSVTLLRNVGSYLPVYTALHPGGLVSLSY